MRGNRFVRRPGQAVYMIYYNTAYSRALPSRDCNIEIILRKRRPGGAVEYTCRRQRYNKSGVWTDQS